MSIHHIEATDPASTESPSASDVSSAEDWWDRWDDLPRTTRDRSPAEVLAEERSNG